MSRVAESKHINTDDGVRLHYLEAGLGPPLVMIPGWSLVWIHQQIPDSRLVQFTEEEGGRHFIFIEGAAKFNQVVATFLD